MIELVAALRDVLPYFNFIAAAITAGGALWVLFGHQYQLTGHLIPLWHRLPLFAVAIGALWVASTCFAQLVSGRSTGMAYDHVGVLGEAVINGALAFIVLSFSAQAWARARAARSQAAKPPTKPTKPRTKAPTESGKGKAGKKA